MHDIEALLDGRAARDAALILGANALPLMGVVFAGWDALTVLMLYWFETAVVGLWVCLAVALSRSETLSLPVTQEQAVKPGVGLGLFILAHAGVFMLVHMAFLMGFKEMRGGSGPLDLVGLLLGQGLWVPLAGLFVIRGLITVSDHVARRPLEPTIIGFYLRIVVMQLVIIVGGMFVALLGNALVPLLLLIGLRTAIDLGVEPIAERIGLGRYRPAGR